MQQLTFHSLTSTGATSESATKPTRKVLVYENTEVVHKRVVPPLRRLCPCFSLWCCLPWIIILAVPIGVAIWDGARDPKRLERPPPLMPPSPPTAPPSPPPPILPSRPPPPPSSPPPPSPPLKPSPPSPPPAPAAAAPAGAAPASEATAHAWTGLRNDGGVCAVRDALSGRAPRAPRALAHGRCAHHGAARAGQSGHLGLLCAPGARLGLINPLEDHARHPADGAAPLPAQARRSGVSSADQ